MSSAGSYSREGFFFDVGAELAGELIEKGVIQGGGGGGGESRKYGKMLL